MPFVGFRRAYRALQPFGRVPAVETEALKLVESGAILRPQLEAYQERCENRPAFQKALVDHMRPFTTKPAA